MSARNILIAVVAVAVLVAGGIAVWWAIRVEQFMEAQGIYNMMLIEHLKIAPLEKPGQ